MQIADVAVVGAGPAGAVAACRLARAGCSVLLLDPQADGSGPSKPGDALAGAALRVLRACDLPLPSDSPFHRPVGGNISVWGGPEPVHRDFLAEPDGPSWRLDRRRFEADLVATALAAGAVVRPRAVRDVTGKAGAWRLCLGNGVTVAARWLVDASGRAATVARRLGARRRRDEGLVAVVGYARPDRAFALERSLVETTPDGWWYAALLPDRRPVFMLHARPAHAARLRAGPGQWHAALSTARHIGEAFPAPVFDRPLRGHDAGGAWLERVCGDGWTACGDAALSFDPCAAQGIFSALHGGMAAADAVRAALRGDMAPLSAYEAQCADVRGIYHRRVRAHYAAERRWPGSAFWQTACAG
jgi:flavin-dependent dehydrogenase